MSTFNLPFEQLPETLPIFPLPNAIVMPGCQLPLNIFEPRYLNMVFDALGAERMIGMVQPDPNDDAPPGIGLYQTGTAGRIISFSETQDGRLLVILSGVCRFDIREELESQRGYRRVMADWSRFQGDYEMPPTPTDPDGVFFTLLRDFFQRKGLDTNWAAMAQMPMPLLVNVLASQLPLDPPERQALIEVVDPEERLTRLTELLEFEVLGNVSGDARRH